MRIAIDFDGTLVTHQYPSIGEPIKGAFEFLRQFKQLGAELILWTMRSDDGADRGTLTDAVEFCRAHGVEFDAVNVGLGDREWTTSPKANADIYIDDLAAGCPRTSVLISPGEFQLVVDWPKLGPSVAAQITRAYAVTSQYKLEDCPACEGLGFTTHGEDQPPVSITCEKCGGSKRVTVRVKPIKEPTT